MGVYSISAARAPLPPSASSPAQGPLSCAFGPAMLVIAKGADG
jgi:hypothetical protein